VLHASILALCLVTGFAALMASAWALLSSKNYKYGSLSRQPAQRLLAQYLHSTPYATTIMFSTTSSRSACQKGWSLIHRTGRARNDVRLAVR
jgi:hypothetical protein